MINIESPAWGHKSLDSKTADTACYQLPHMEDKHNFSCHNYCHRYTHRIRSMFCKWKKILTYTMVQSPSWAANWFAASQEIPRILWNLKVHYRTHKHPQPIPILGQPTPVHMALSPPPYKPHAQPISFFSILSPTQYWVRSTDHSAPCYAISSIHPLPRPS